MVNLWIISKLLGWHPFFKSSETFFPIDLRLSTRRFTFFFLGGFCGFLLLSLEVGFFVWNLKQRLVTRCSWHHFVFEVWDISKEKYANFDVPNVFSFSGRVSTEILNKQTKTHNCHKKGVMFPKTFDFQS